MEPGMELVHESMDCHLQGKRRWLNTKTLDSKSGIALPADSTGDLYTGYVQTPTWNLKQRTEFLQQKQQTEATKHPELFSSSVSCLQWAVQVSADGHTWNMQQLRQTISSIQRTLPLLMAKASLSILKFVLLLSYLVIRGHNDAYVQHPKPFQSPTRAFFPQDMLHCKSIRIRK